MSSLIRLSLLLGLILIGNCFSTARANEFSSNVTILANAVEPVDCPCSCICGIPAQCIAAVATGIFLLFGLICCLIWMLLRCFFGNESGGVRGKGYAPIGQSPMYGDETRGLFSRLQRSDLRRLLIIGYCICFPILGALLTALVYLLCMMICDGVMDA